jgi:phosphatidylinositol-3-phosphatase
MGKTLERGGIHRLGVGVGAILFFFVAATLLWIPRPSAATVVFSHVFIVMEENHSYSEVVGNSSMPYLNMLINNYGLATHYYSNGHPSLPNYLWMTSGSNDGITTDVCPAMVTADNIVRHFDAQGITWKAYEEDLPSVGYMGCSSGQYAARHDPFVYFSDVKNNAADQKKIVPFTQFVTDLTNDTFAQYSFITPNVCNDAHDCALSVADAWLKDNIAPLLNTNAFQPGGDGVLIITFDEGTDNTNGGGQVAWVIVGPKVKEGYRSTTLYQHQNTLRLMMEGLGATSFPQNAATASDMAEFFGTMTSTPSPSPSKTPSPTPTASPAATPTPKGKHHSHL